MEKIKNAAELKEAIKKLEQKQAEEWKALKAQTDISFNNANPLNILKNALSDVISVPDPSDEKAPDMWMTALSMLAGYGAKKLIVQKSESTMTNLLGTVVQFGVTNLVANNAHIIKMAATRVIDLVVLDKKNYEAAAAEATTENQ